MALSVALNNSNEWTVVAKSAGAATSRVLVANTLTAHARTPAEQLAAIAVDQLKSREVQIVRAR